MPYNGYSGPGIYGRGFGQSLPTPGFWARLQTDLNLTNGTGSPTYSRATIATVTDHEGIIRRCVSGEARFYGARRIMNHLIDSQTPTKVGASCTITAGQTDPLGGTTAYKVEYAAASSSHRAVYSAPDTMPAGSTCVASVWLRGEIGGEVIRLWDGQATHTTLPALTTTWKRYQVIISYATSLSMNILLYANAGTPTIYCAFGQVEDISGASVQVAGDYVSAGILSSPWHGAGVDGVKYFDTTNGNSVASNVVTEAAGSAISPSTLLGYFSEGPRTNRCLQSEEFDEAVWVSGGGGVAVDDQAVAAPDGATTADTLTASGANGTLIQDLGVVASAAKTFSVWLKRKTGTGNIDLTMDGGATWTTVAVTGTWTRFTKTQTLADEDVGIRIVTSGDEVYAWGAQVETASFASSYIPTTTAAVARNTDALTYPGTGNIAAGVGVSFAESAQFWTGTDGASGRLIDVNNNGSALMYFANSGGLKLAIYDGSTQNFSSAFVAGSTVQKCASKWAPAASMKTYVGGVAGTDSGVFDGAVSVGTLSIGSIGGGSSGQSFGTIRNVKIWQVALTDAQVATL